MQIVMHIFLRGEAQILVRDECEIILQTFVSLLLVPHLPVIVEYLEVPHVGDVVYACIICRPLRRSLSMFGIPAGGMLLLILGRFGAFGGAPQSSKNGKSSGCMIMMLGLVSSNDGLRLVVVVVVVVGVGGGDGTWSFSAKQ